MVPAVSIVCGVVLVVPVVLVLVGDHLVPTGGLGEGAVHEDYGGPGFVLWVGAVLPPRVSFSRPSQQ
jgi:hypothetical protein